MRPTSLLTIAAALALLPSCQASEEDAAATATAEQAAAAPQADSQALARQRELQRTRDRARQEAGEVRFVVDKSDREVRVFRGDEQIRTHDVAVGSSEHETPTGEWTFDRVDLNPEWIPPDSEWAEDRERKAPGAPGNPMGRARLVFNMPYTIHGTDNLDSLGKAVSHGSIRVANENVIPLAELLLKAGGAWEGEQWFRKMAENRNEEYQIELPEDVRIEVQE